MVGLFKKCLVLFSIIGFMVSCTTTGSIDRFKLVHRNNITVENFDTLASLSVGNGNFEFTTDFTGLQTFYKEYEKGVSLGTMSNWGWHTLPNTENYDISETYKYFDVEGRKVPYEHQLKGNEREIGASNYFRENPHRLHLGVIRLVVIREDGKEIEVKDVQDPLHHLDMWKGEITSNFKVEGEKVEVKVFVHQELDMVSAQIKSSLIGEGRLAVEWIFPYGRASHTHPGYDFSVPDKHTSRLELASDHGAVIKRKLDDDIYYTSIDWNKGANLKEVAPHRFRLIAESGSSSIEFSSLFSPENTEIDLPNFKETAQNNDTHWKDFWESGGAVDFSACKDPRAKELERRTVLSQYLTKIGGSGNLPPQETGLTFNSWYGKFHLEMLWWHSAHFANWQRSEYMAPQLDFYHTIMDKARDIAEMQGYAGVRWPKMIGPEGLNSPSSVGSYLIWQQPHPIYLAEQLYQANPSQEILEKYADLVFASAEFMADFPVFDAETGVYNLAPPLIPAQEHWTRETTMNPPFELAYWNWGLSVAQEWKKRMGEPIEEEWEKVRLNLPDPVAIDGLYMGIANAPDSYTKPSNMRDHPMVLGTYGILPLWDKINPEIMRNTLNVVMENWDWPQTWGWDYPMTAMCATRLMEPEIAIEALLKDVQKNTYLVNGHNYQDERLRIYLPGNGGLLKTIALMCAGWEGCEVENPGFPKDGNWDVKWENLSPDF